MSIENCQQSSQTNAPRSYPTQRQWCQQLQFSHSSQVIFLSALWLFFPRPFLRHGRTISLQVLRRSLVPDAGGSSGFTSSTWYRYHWSSAVTFLPMNLNWSVDFVVKHNDTMCCSFILVLLTGSVGLYCKNIFGCCRWILRTLPYLTFPLGWTGSYTLCA